MPHSCQRVRMMHWGRGGLRNKQVGQFQSNVGRGPFLDPWALGAHSQCGETGLAQCSEQALGEVDPRVGLT